jgi:hypothetical protein
MVAGRVVRSRMVVVELACVSLAMGADAWRAMRWTMDGRMELGLLILGPVAIGAFAIALLLAGPTVALALPMASTVAGFVLALRSGGGGEDGGDEEPPWWPSFEDGLREYERERATPRLG